MKMVPISFEQRYSDESFAENYYKGFKPFVTDANEYISERWVKITPTIWNGGHGAALMFEIWERVNPRNGKSPHNRKIYDTWIYDLHPSKDLEMVRPTSDQARLMGALASQELRGKYCESIVHDLYVDLFLLNDKSGAATYLPDVVKFWKDHYEKHDFTKTSK